MKKYIVFYICILTFFVSSSVLASVEVNKFYNVDSLLEGLTPSDIGTHFKLNTPAPSFLYHWISHHSLESLFSEKENTVQMPLKTVGTVEYQSLIVKSAPALIDQKGLFAWHNPVAFYGGSGEIYGEGEVLLELKINPNARVGVIVTEPDQNHPITKLNLKNYDVLLHISAAPDGKTVMPIYLEWIVMNPDVVTNVTADPLSHSKKLEVYERALREIQESRRPDPKKAHLSDIEILAGISHNTYLSAGMSPQRINERISKINENASKVPSFLKGSGLSFISKSKAQCSGYY